MREHRATCSARGTRPERRPVASLAWGGATRNAGRAGRARLWSLRSVLRRIERLTDLEDEIAAAEAEDPNA
jgi:hypothetical protein